MTEFEMEIVRLRPGEERPPALRWAMLDEVSPGRWTGDGFAPRPAENDRDSSGAFFIPSAIQQGYAEAEADALTWCKLNGVPTLYVRGL